MIIANFTESTGVARTQSAYQYDYGQILRIQGLELPKLVEVHFSLDDKEGESTRRIATTRDNITDVAIPDTLLNNQNAEEDYKIYVFVYVSSKETGKTVEKIIVPVKSRPEPEAFETEEEQELFKEAVDAVKESAENAESFALEAEAWAHGNVPDHADQDEDNAKYYAQKAKDAAACATDTIAEGKKQIDAYVKEKEHELKGERGDVNFTGFKVVKGKLIMIHDPGMARVKFKREGAKLKYRFSLQEVM